MRMHRNKIIASSSSEDQIAIGPGNSLVSKLIDIQDIIYRRYLGSTKLA